MSDRLRDDLLLKSLSVPMREEYFDPAGMLEAMRQDKKRTGSGLVMVMMRDDYSFEKAVDFTEDELNAGIRELREILHV
jgi:3-dehydroquinate synthetase